MLNFFGKVIPWVMCISLGIVSSGPLTGKYFSVITTGYFPCKSPCFLLQLTSSLWGYGICFQLWCATNYHKHRIINQHKSLSKVLVGQKSNLSGFIPTLPFHRLRLVNTQVKKTDPIRVPRGVFGLLSTLLRLFLTTIQLLIGQVQIAEVYNNTEPKKNGHHHFSFKALSNESNNPKCCHHLPPILHSAVSI